MTSSLPEAEPVPYDVALRTAEVLAAALPPVDLVALADDPALRELERLLGSGVRIAILRARFGDWEVRAFDPERPSARQLEPGRGPTASAALEALLEQLVE